MTGLETPRIAPGELKRGLDQEDALFLVDVRQPAKQQKTAGADRVRSRVREIFLRSLSNVMLNR